MRQMSLFIFALLVTSISAELIISTPNGTRVPVDCIQVIYKGNPSSLIEEPIASGATSNSSLVNGRIYLIRASLPVEVMILDAQKNGAVAVIVITPVFYVPGYLAFRINNREVASQISIPVFEVAAPPGRTLWGMLTEKAIQNITIVPQEKVNEWEVSLTSGWIYLWPVTVTLFCGANIALGIWKITQFTEFYGGFKSSIAIYILCIEILSNSIRFVASIDNFGAFSLYPEWAQQCFTELSFPIALSSFMLFSLYWHEMMTNASLIVHPFITKMRIPFFVLSSAIVALQIIRTILRSAAAIDNLSMITAIVYLVIAMSIIIFYAITGGKLLVRLHKSKNMGKTVNLTKTTVRILVSGGFILFFVLCLLLFITGLPYRPIGFVTTWYFFFMVMNAASLMNILAFKLPSKFSSGSKKQNSSKDSLPSVTSTAVPMSEATVL